MTSATIKVLLISFDTDTLQVSIVDFKIPLRLLATPSYWM